MALLNQPSEAFSHAVHRACELAGVPVPKQAVAVCPVGPDGRRKIAFRLVQITSDPRNLPVAQEVRVSRESRAHYAFSKLFSRGTSVSDYFVFRHKYEHNTPQWVLVDPDTLEPRKIKGRTVVVEYVPTIC